jgi:hypothetical protein
MNAILATLGSGLVTATPAILGLLQQFLPQIAGSSPAIGMAVKAVVALAPVVASSYKDLKPMIGNVITALKSDPAALPDQIAELEKAEAILDAEFDEAAAAALAEDMAAAGKK